MRPGQDQRVSDIVRMVDQSAAGVAAHKRPLTRHRRRLEVAEADRRDIPFIDAQDRVANLAEERLIDGHVPRRRGGAVSEKTPTRHGLIIHVFAVTNGKDEDEQLPVLDLAEDAIVTNAASP